MNRLNLDMPVNEIRAALMAKLGPTATNKIAADLNITVAAVNFVIRNLRSSERIRKAISSEIGVPVERIWPSLYATGSPRRRGRPQKAA